jgi:hypothetical protein
MTDEYFKIELALFAGHVEERRAQGILVDVGHSHHKPGSAVQQWRVKNISSGHHAAGVQRIGFLFPKGSQIPQGINQSSEGEIFLTRAFSDREDALTFLVG